MLGEKDLERDAIVIGSGLGGSSFAYGLAKRGFSVLVVDRGEFLLPPDPNDLAPVHMQRLAGRPAIGGASKVYGAAMYRLREGDFRATAMESGVSPAWPFEYGELEPWYGEAERLFRVHGSSDGDASEPARSTPWPHAPIPHQGPVRELVARLEERAGARVSHVPRAIDWEADGSGRCVLCKHCDAYYCPRDAKLDAEVAALRPAMRTGRVEVWPRTECVRVLTSDDGKRAIGARIRIGGEERDVRARIVCAASGLVETPLLLWRSRTARHPNGLANASGALGRHLAAHTQGWVLPIARSVQRSAFHQKTFAINALYSSSPGWPHPTGVIQAAAYIEPVSIRRLARPFVSLLLRNSFQTFVMTESLGTMHTGFALSDAGATPIAPPVQNTQTFARLRRHAIELFRTAGHRVVAPRHSETMWHAVGTARMGSDPATSVLDGNCRAHDVEGLYVADASALPSAGAVNNGLTIVAVALRAAARVPMA